MPRRLPRLATALLLTAAASFAQSPLSTPYPILFVTQTPFPQDFATVTAVLGNHLASPYAAPRGGDLWIRYPDGALKNLTEAAGFGHAGLQDATAIAVRDPAVHWSGTKAIFSMIVGAPAQYQTPVYRWRLYEIVGLGPTDTPVVTLVPHQPLDANNVSPAYGTDDRILFVSDRPRGGAAHHAPQRDEYESAASTTGVWSLDPVVGVLRQLTHSPSGDFRPFVDSFGRVVFTRWDHLQRDQQADAAFAGTPGVMQPFNWAGEDPAAPATTSVLETFPEPRQNRPDLLAGTPFLGHLFNHFLPWQMQEDGGGLETLSHVGRHELHSYFERARGDDPNLVTFQAALSGRVNPRSILNFLHVAEDPTAPGTYFGVDGNEFGTHASGQIVKFSAPPTLNPDAVVVDYVTHRDTSFIDDTPSPDHTGHYRDPRPLSDGTVLVAHTSATGSAGNLGTSSAPIPTHQFRLKPLVAAGAYATAGAPLTTGLAKSLSWWSPDALITYSGPLWELQPVEVVARPRPARLTAPLEAPELAAFASAGVDPLALRAWLAASDLALIVTRDATTRDAGDRQQPFNLAAVPPTGTGGLPPHQTTGAPGTVYPVAGLQIYQGDLLRSYTSYGNTLPGRRVLPTPLHEASEHRLAAPGLPAGSTPIAVDGSLAAFVPARRALTWQLVAPDGAGVVKERNWLSFAPGEIRTCGSCHGVNTHDQALQPPPTSTPLALVQLLEQWKLARQAESPSLGAAGAGTVGLGGGGPFDVLTIDGSSGGAARRVDLSAAAPFTIAMSAPPGLATAPFALFGLLGAPGPASSYTPAPLAGEGAFVFAPPFAAAAPATTFTLANGLWTDPSALAPGGVAPWALPVAGLPPLVFTLQALTIDAPPAGPFGFSNAVIVRVL